MKIIQDLHVHTHLSMCAERSATPEAIIAQSKRLGLRSIGIADHMWAAEIPYPASAPGGKVFYEMQPTTHAADARAEFGAIDCQGIEVLFGCETEYDLERRDIGLTEEEAKKMDFIIVPTSHTHMVMPTELYTPYQAHADFMLRAYKDVLHSPLVRYITAMAHPFAAVCCPYDNAVLFDLITDAQYREIFTESAARGVAVEINSACLEDSAEKIQAHPSMRMYRIAHDCGCKFTIGSDSHSDTEQGTLPRAALLADLLGLTEDDIQIAGKR